MRGHLTRRAFLGGAGQACLSAAVWRLASSLGLADAPAPISQPSWATIQMPAAAEVAAGWKTPPPAYGPEPYYGFNGPMNEAVIERDLDTMKSLGFRAVTVQAGPDMPYPYLSEGYFDLFKKLVEQAKRREMKVWIVDDAGYPSGFAGGKFTESKPALRMQALELAQKIPVAGGETARHAVSPETVSALAVSGDGVQEAVPIKNGGIEWTAPPGQWTLLIVEHQFRTSPTRSATNPRNVKDTEQSLEDYMNPAATRQYLAWTHERYKRYVGNEFGKTILGFRGDEPDYSIRGLPWTNAFFDRFQRIKGYDVRPYVAGFFLPELTEEQTRVRADYWDVFSRMFGAGFFGVLGGWCAANRLEYQFHLNHEEREMELAHSEGGFFRDMRAIQVPGIDAIWHQIWTDTISDYPRLASSAAHVCGKPRAFTESFAAYRPRPDVAQARYILNEQFVRGVNLVEVMYFPSTSRGAHPPFSFLGEPEFPALMRYVQRMSYLMSMGRPAASVALYLPTSSFWLGDSAANQDFVSTERLLSEHPIDFDIVSEDALARDLVLDHGAFRTLSGNRYRTVILPGQKLLSEAALGRLRAFARGGGRVLFLGHLPSLISRRTIRDARPAIPDDFSWAAVEVSAELSPTPTPGQFAPPAPPSPQVVPEAILLALDRAIPERDLTLYAPESGVPESGAPSTALRYMRRELENASVFLFFNESDRALRRRVALHARGTKTELWDPQTGEVHPQASTRDRGSLAVDLTLPPYETRVLVVR